MAKGLTLRRISKFRPLFFCTISQKCTASSCFFGAFDYLLSAILLTVKNSNPSWSKHIKSVAGYPKLDRLDAVIESLERLARILGPEKQMPRARELANALGVTLMTLVRGLAHLERRGLLERHPRRGVFVSPNIKQKAVGCIMGWDIFSGGGDEAVFFSLLLTSCIKQAKLMNHRFSIFVDATTPSQATQEAPGHQELIDALSIGRFDGLLLISPQGFNHESWLKQFGLPVVSIKHVCQPGGVKLDGDTLIYEAAKELKRQGVKTVGLIYPFDSEVIVFRKAAADLGLRIDEGWIIPHRDVIKSTESLDWSGREAAKRVMEQSLGPNGPGLPEGIIINNDIIARSACSYFSEQGIRIGETLQVVSHANKGSRILKEWEERLTRCEYDPQEIAEALFSQLDACMNGESQEKRPGIMVAPHLCRRKKKA